MSDLLLTALERLTLGGHCQISPSPQGVMYYGEIKSFGLVPANGGLALTVKWRELWESRAMTGEAHNWVSRPDVTETVIKLGDYTDARLNGAGSATLTPRVDSDKLPVVTFYNPGYEPSFHPYAMPATCMWALLVDGLAGSPGRFHND